MAKQDLHLTRNIGTDKLENLIDRHAVAEHTGNELGIVPEFGIELVAQSFDCGLDRKSVV